MSNVTGKYVLECLNSDTQLIEFSLFSPFAGEISHLSFNGVIEVEGENFILEVRIIEGETLSLKSANAEQLSLMHFDLQTGEGNIRIERAAESGMLIEKVKLTNYEYNNTHFVIQYSRIFRGVEEMLYKTEVIFNVED